MNKSALKYLVHAGIAPEERLIRQNAFAMNRTQQRKREPYTKVRSSGSQPCKSKG